MVPFIVLLVTFLISRAIGFTVPYLGEWQHCLQIALAAMFLLTASAHWGKLRPDLIRMVPPSFPRPDLWVTLTGIAEIAGAVGLVWPPAQKTASVGLALLLIAVFPANVYAARNHLTIGGREVPQLAVRLPMQIVFLAAVIAAGWC